MQPAIEAAKATGQAMALVGVETGTGPRSTVMSMVPKLGGPTLKQPLFDLSTKEKFTKLRNFQIEVNSIFIIYNTNDTEKTPII